MQLQLWSIGSTPVSSGGYVLAIALANKLARIAWSVLARGRAFEASKLQIA